MCITEYDEERTLRLTFEEGKEEGEELKKKEMIRGMIKENIDFAIIARVAKCTIEEVEAIASEMNAA